MSTMELLQLLKRRKPRVESVVSSLSDAGFVTEERRAPHVERANELWLKVFPAPQWCN